MKTKKKIEQQLKSAITKKFNILNKLEHYRFQDTDRWIELHNLDQKINTLKWVLNGN